MTITFTPETEIPETYTTMGARSGYSAEGKATRKEEIDLEDYQKAKALEVERDTEGKIIKQTIELENGKVVTLTAEQIKAIREKEQSYLM